MAAAALKLDRITAIMDCNGMQSCGAVKDILSIETLEEK